MVSAFFYLLAAVNVVAGTFAAYSDGDYARGAYFIAFAVLLNNIGDYYAPKRREG